MDWISTFMDITAEIPSPPRFRRWAAISTLSGALERRVYTRTRATRPAYPNLYVCLAGKSGAGKTESINLARDLWVALGDTGASARRVHLSPDNLTNAAFYDALAEATQTYMNGTGASVYHALAVCCRELGVLLPKYDAGFLSDLSDLFDNLPNFTSKRRVSTSVDISMPTVNILGAVTPGFLGDMLPEVAWAQGFCSRMIFIYDHRVDPPGTDVLRHRRPLNLAPLRPRLQQIWELGGEVEWSAGAHSAINEWFNAGQPPRPEHHRLREYCERRLIHLLKLSMISAVSAGHDLRVEESDFATAQKWLFDAEDAMPDVFRAMLTKSDMQLIEEMHYHIYSIWMRTGRSTRNPVKESEIWNFLGERAESHRIPSLIDLAERTGKMKKGSFGGDWVPSPLSNRTPEAEKRDAESGAAAPALTITPSPSAIN